MQINKNSGIPLYLQLKTWLIEQIDLGTYKPGDQIPTENELYNLLEISKGPIRQAIKELVIEGKLYFVRGIGTFVAHNKPDNWQIITSVSFSDALDNMGVSFTTQILEKKVISAKPDIASKLKVVPGTKVIYLKRLRFLEGDPSIIMVSYLIEKLVPELAKLDLIENSLYKSIANICNIQIMTQDRIMYIGYATNEEAKLLNIPKSSVVQRFEDLAYDSERVLIEYSNTVFRGDKSRFHLEISRKI